LREELGHDLDTAQILRILWRHRLWVALGWIVAWFVAYAVTFKVTFPPGLEPRGIEFGAASTKILIDAGRSPLLDVEAEVDPLATRAQLYARLVESDPVKEAIARKAGFEPAEIVIGGRTAISTFRSAREPAAEQRANQLAGESQQKRLLFAAEEELPVLSIYAQGRTANEAIRLADAGAQGLIAYVETLQARGSVPAASSVELRQLGGARGALVNPSASETLALLVFVGVFAFWCILVLLGANVATGLREAGGTYGVRDDFGASCLNCGAGLSPETRFCPHCGAETVGRAAAAMVEPRAGEAEAPQIPAGGPGVRNRVLEALKPGLASSPPSGDEDSD
jgi:hypothetical protein